MNEAQALNPFGSLILLGILMFIVYRILQAINSNHLRTGQEGVGGGGNVIHPPRWRKKAEPPATVSLRSLAENESPFSPDDAEIAEIHETLVDRNGMVFIGDFAINEMSGYHIRAYTSPEFSLVGIVYSDQAGRRWVNLITEYKDGRVITSSSADTGNAKSPRPRGMPLFSYPGLPIDQLFRRHKLETRAADKEKPVTPEGFADFFADNYARLREVVSGADEETRTASITTLPGIELPSREDEAFYGDSFTPSARQLKQWLESIYAAYPVPEEKRGEFQRGLVWVNEGASIDSISQTVSRYSGVTMEEVQEGKWVIRSESGVEDIIEPGDLKGPALFEKINACLPAGKKFFRLPVNLEGVVFYSRARSET